jgi:hypothetical protein
VAAAVAYREMLDALDGHVRAHLRLASGVLAELRPPRQVQAKAGPGADRLM